MKTRETLQRVLSGVKSRDFDRAESGTLYPNVAEILATAPDVIPAKAGIHAVPKKMDSRLRGNDRRSEKVRS